MQNSYKTVEKAGTGEIEEKKSRFLAEIRSVHSEEEAAAFLEEIRKKYWNASHHCLAYRLAEGGIMRSSDDGEPGGTAGRPILDVLTGADLYDTAAIVTRYFGGTLLGTGGLTRAYGSAARAALESCTVIVKQRGIHLLVKTDYTVLGWLKRLESDRHLVISGADYAETVYLDILVTAEEAERFKQELLNETGGKARIETGEPCWFVM